MLNLNEYILSDESVVQKATSSKVSLMLLWLSVPSVFLVNFLLTLPSVIKKMASKAFREAVSAELGIRESDIGFFDLFSSARLDIYSFIPDFVFTLMRISVTLLVMAWLFWAIYSTSRQLQNGLLITNKRLYAYSGNRVLYTSFSQVKKVSVENSLWGRMFNYGSVHILTEKGAMSVKNINKAAEWKEKLIYLSENGYIDD